MTTKGKVIWHDIVKPTREDLGTLRRIHKFHPVTLDELLQYSERSRVEVGDGYLFLTYHLPVYEPEIRTSRRGEIDFLITKNAVITVHYEDLEPITSFKQALDRNPDQKKLYLSHTALLVYHLMEELINYSLRQIRHIEEEVKYVSQEIFSSKETEMLRKISYAKRNILDYSIISEPREILLQSFVETGIKFWGAGVKIYLNDLVSDHSKITRHLRNYRDTIESLEETNHQLLEARTNRVIQRFTVLAFAFSLPLISIFVLTLVPFTEEIGSFKLISILGIGIVCSVSTLYIAWKKKWI